MDCKQLLDGALEAFVNQPGRSKDNNWLTHYLCPLSRLMTQREDTPLASEGEAGFIALDATGWG